MDQFLQKLKSRFRSRRSQQAREATINDVLQKGLLRVRNADPDTHQQWLRLQQAIAQRDTEAAPRKSRLIPRLALGMTGVVVALVGTYVYFSFFSSKSSSDTIVTGRGEQKEVVLGDGSQITLNHTTELVMAKLQPREPRRVSLAGEAYFRVQPRQVGETPFIVSTDYADVQVVGTEFNLRAREGVLEVAVISGMVNVTAVKEGKDSALMLTDREMAVCPQGDYPRRIGDIPSPEYPGWIHGKLFLNKTSFAAACHEIEMWFDITIKIDERTYHSDMITGILDAKSAESALAALCEVAGKKFTHDGRAYHIY